MTRLRARSSGFEFRQWQESFLQNAQTGSEAHTAPYSMGTGVISRGQRGRDIMLTTHLDLVPRIIMCGAIHLLLLYAFMARAGTILTFTIILPVVSSRDVKHVHA